MQSQEAQLTIMQASLPGALRADLLKRLLAAALALLLCLPRFTPGRAQSATEWLNPSNLSQSGAASAPRLIVPVGGGLQAFWWDRFDGLMASRLGEDGAWSEPTPMRIRSNKLESTPRLFADPAGMLYALWTEAQPATASVPVPQRALYVSQMGPRDTAWSIPRRLVESAAAFDVQRAPSGEVRLVYIRTLNTPQAPAGIYLLKKPTPTANWSQPILVYASKYVRLLEPEQAQIRLTLSGAPDAGQLDLVTWPDPLSQELQLTFSTDAGATWAEPQPLKAEETVFSAPRVLPGERPALVWQSVLQGGCSLYQQELRLQGDAAAGQRLAFGPLEPIIQRMPECPSGEEQFETLDGQLLWIWGIGGSRLTLAARSADGARWTLPRRLSVDFENPQTGQNVSLGDLHPALADSRLYVIGADPTRNEVWAAQASAAALELAYAEPSPWGEAQRLELGGEAAGAPALVVDDQSRTHLVWSAAAAASGPGTALYYAQSSPSGLLGPFKIVPEAAGNLARQPALFYESRRQILHLVWSGGTDGSLLYSWVSAAEANAPTAWSSPKTLSSLADSSWPQIASDGGGTLYVLFAVPLNEARGVYLTRSTDNGASWSEPTLVYDARASQTPMVSHPALAVEPNGRLHAAWVNSQAPGGGGALNVHYSLSLDGGETWSAPLILAGEGFSWPRLAASDGQLHLIYVSEKAGQFAVYQRYIRVDQDFTDGGAWSSPLAIPSWPPVALPFGLACNGAGGPEGNLYLLGADPRAGMLYYAAWGGERWTPVEMLSEIYQVGRGLDVGAAAQPLGGRLAVGWLAYTPEEGSEEAALFLISRQIPTLSAPPPPVPTNTPAAAQLTPTPSATPRPTQPPTPTPDINQTPQGPSLPLPPMALGGILVGFLVAAIFAGRFLIKQFNPRHR